MSQLSVPDIPVQPPEPPASSQRTGRGRRFLKRIWIPLVIAAGSLLLFLYGVQVYRTLVGKNEVDIPVARVQRGDVSLAVTARGELRGGNPETLMAPMIGGSDLHITFLKQTGATVKSGEVVVRFDTTEQEYKLKEAEADLAEAEQHILQARAQREADQEEDRYAVLKAKADVKVAELDVKKNQLLSAIAAKQNDLALESARDHLAQVERNSANRQATGEAGVNMQEAGRVKAEAQATTARQNIEAMTLRAHRAGYFSVKQNSQLDMAYPGMRLPMFQVGDTVHAGMAVAEIPDLTTWELGANVSELDRGHLSMGAKAVIQIVAVPGHDFHGHVKGLGGTAGFFWDRHFECLIALDDPSPQLRPGMSANITVTTDTMQQALWIPAQAIFESDGRTFVYVGSGKSFRPKDVKLLRRNETRAVISGLLEGQTVALANPVEVSKSKPGLEANPLKTVGR